MDIVICTRRVSRYIKGDNYRRSEELKKVEQESKIMKEVV